MGKASKGNKKLGFIEHNPDPTTLKKIYSYLIYKKCAPQQTDCNRKKFVCWEGHFKNKKYWPWVTGTAGRIGKKNIYRTEVEVVFFQTSGRCLKTLKVIPNPPRKGSCDTGT